MTIAVFVFGFTFFFLEKIGARSLKDVSIQGGTSLVGVHFPEEPHSDSVSLEEGGRMLHLFFCRYCLQGRTSCLAPLEYGLSWRIVKLKRD